MRRDGNRIEGVGWDGMGNTTLFLNSHTTAE